MSALPERAVFYAAVAPLLAFYALFAAVIYPAAPALHLDPAPLLGMVPAGLAGLVKVVANWSYSLFFCFAELWGGVVISVLFWCAPRPGAGPVRFGLGDGRGGNGWGLCVCGCGVGSVWRGRSAGLGEGRGHRRSVASFSTPPHSTPQHTHCAHQHPKVSGKRDGDC